MGSITYDFNEKTGELTVDGKTGDIGERYVMTEYPWKNLPFTKLTIKSATGIGYNAFSGCGSLETVSLTLKSCSYKNNTNPGEMQIIPAVNYGKDAETKKLLQDHKDLKKVISSMLNPKYDKKNDKWNYNRILVEIDQITLDNSTPVYNLKGMSKEQKKELESKDGVLVWNGDGQKIKFTTLTVKDNAKNGGGKGKAAETKYYIPTKAVIPGLYYQRVFDLPNGKKAIKKINLRDGGWSVKSKKNEEGKKYGYVEAASGACDYYCSEPDAEGSEEKPSWIGLELNTEGRKDTKAKTVAVPGFFKGSLPDIGLTAE
ncbi:MAG: hypothetical protein J5910_05100 [Lachnospiraceae bacterium]|nr:hypothetical protein [Lachnospiraceae bacterium]